MDQRRLAEKVKTPTIQLITSALQHLICTAATLLQRYLLHVDEVLKLAGVDAKHSLPRHL